MKVIQKMEYRETAQGRKFNLIQDTQRQKGLFSIAGRSQFMTGMFYTVKSRLKSIKLEIKQKYNYLYSLLSCLVGTCHK